MSQGRVVEQGTHEELMALGKEYFNLVTAQVKTSEAVEASQKGNKEVAPNDDHDDDDDIKGLTHNRLKTVLILFLHYKFEYISW